jgi:2OG-Fe(II) oxygenase superfamily
MSSVQACSTRTDASLSVQNLKDLISNRIQILRIPDFIDKQACHIISAGLQKNGYNDYLNAPSVGRIGMSYFETGLKPDLIQHYFDNAIGNIEVLRQACYPYPCPVDTLRCRLDEQWPAGCHLQTLYNQKMFVGLSRSMKPHTPLLPHHDMFGRHAPNTPESTSLISQFGMNVYVDVPAEGGELAMWMDEISDQEFLKKRGDHYAIPLELLKAPDFSIKPNNGDLILFNARKLHAVLPGSGTDRLTLSAFLGYRGDANSLTVWS